MRTVTIEEAQLHLAELLDDAEVGKPFLIARAGKPVAEVTKVELGDASLDKEPLPKRKLGMLAGKYIVPDDIKTPFREEIEEMFYGKE